MKRFWVVIVLLIIAGIGGYYLYCPHQKNPEIVLSGNVDIREVNVSFRVGGRVTDVLVEEGDKVSKGSILAKIDPEPLKERLAQSEAALAAAQAEEDLLLAGTRKEELARLKAQLESLRVVLKNAKTNYQRQKELLSTNANSKQAYDDAKTDRDRTQADYEATYQAYRKAVNGARPEQLAQAAANRDEAIAQRDIAALNLRDTTLISPSSGTVITRAVEPGTMVNEGTTIITLSLDHPVRVRAYVEEPDLGYVAPGTQVLVYTDSRPDKPYSGTVGFVSPRAEFTPKQVETQDLRTKLVYRLRITIENADNMLRQGMPVTVRLKKQEH